MTMRVVLPPTLLQVIREGVIDARFPYDPQRHRALLARYTAHFAEDFRPIHCWSVSQDRASSFFDSPFTAKGFENALIAIEKIWINYFNGTPNERYYGSFEWWDAQPPLPERTAD